MSPNSGGSHVTIPIESPEDAAHEFLRLGAEAEVLADSAPSPNERRAG
jgi:hypothetical protein